MIESRNLGSPKTRGKKEGMKVQTFQPTEGFPLASQGRAWQGQKESLRDRMEIGVDLITEALGLSK